MKDNHTGLPTLCFHPRIRALLGLALAVTGLLASLACRKAPQTDRPVRAGYFANFTHAQALIGRTRGDFAHKLGKEPDWKVFGAGPSEMEALLAGELDMAYVGPNPAINAYVRSEGRALRIVAGVCSGGAGLVVGGDSGIRTAADLRGKRVAAPETGNTQDIALRRWLRSNGLEPGRDLQVLSVKNPEILTLFHRGGLEAAWVPEPWLTRLLREGGGRLLVDERTLWPEGRFATAVLVARREFLERQPEKVAGFVAAHAALTTWINGHPAEARELVNRGLTSLLGKPVPPPILQEAMGRVYFTTDPMAQAISSTARAAWELGFLPGTAPPDLSGLFAPSGLHGADAK